MKMAYERPVMKIEVFQPNEYVAACDRIPVIGAVGQFFTAIWNNYKFYFSSDRKDSVNPLTKVPEYYFVEDSDYKDKTGAIDGEDYRYGNGETLINNWEPLYGYTGSSTYFLGYDSSAAQGEQFVIYEDKTNSGWRDYDDFGNRHSGVGTLQAEADEWIGSWGGTEDSMWFADAKVGVATNITTETQDGVVGATHSF